MNVGTFIKKSRENLGVSQKQVINTINRNFKREYRISTGHLSEVEQGKTGVSLSKLNAITWALLKLGQ